jgi:hypothetical protein
MTPTSTCLRVGGPLENTSMLDGGWGVGAWGYGLVGANWAEHAEHQSKNQRRVSGAGDMPDAQHASCRRSVRRPAHRRATRGATWRTEKRTAATTSSRLALLAEAPTAGIGETTDTLDFSTVSLEARTFNPGA